MLEGHVVLGGFLTRIWCENKLSMKLGVGKERHQERIELMWNYLSNELIFSSASS